MRTSKVPVGAAGLAGLCVAILAAAITAPAQIGDWSGSRKIDEAIQQAVTDGLTPGAVAWIESRGRRLHFASYGSRSLQPEREPMTLETIFDCASMTKVMATAPSIMILVEEGKIRLGDSITTYLPEFRTQSRINVRDLLTHFSGLRPVLDLDPPWSGYAHGVSLALQETPVNEPRSKFVYSDINYVLLAEIVRRASGMPLNEFAERRIYEPLGMNNTTFLPAENLRGRIAPTEVLKDGTILRGVVHDPTTRMMGGVSGQAGLFSTAVDVAKFARMMLNGGELDGTRILSPLSVLRMRTPQSPEGKAARGLGWDIDTPYSSPRGDLFGTASYGHTGYTGTSLWIDPTSQSFVALMTNRVHPKVGTSVVRLRSLIASITAANLDRAFMATRERGRFARARAARTPFSAVRTGLDTLVADGFSPLDGKSVGLITNHTGRDRQGRRNIDLLAEAANVNLVAIFTPEHGLEGNLDEPEIRDGTDTRTGTRIYSLYQSGRRRPSPASLEGLDALVFDVQDAGARFYTYITTMGYAMEAAAEAGITFVVLDRPNPINGIAVEGPILDQELESFIGYHRIPVRHGMTVGELARMFNEERDIGTDLTVVPMQGWERHLWYDETGLPWINPSPNLRNLDQATLYPGIAMLEWLDQYSVGRGTDTPFQFVGADWINGSDLAGAIRQSFVPGVRVYPRKLRPAASVLEGTIIDGVQFSITNRDVLQPTQLGLAVARAVKNLYPDKVDLGKTERLIGSRAAIEGLNAGQNIATILSSNAEALEEFGSRRRRYLLY